MGGDQRIAMAADEGRGAREEGSGGGGGVAARERLALAALFCSRPAARGTMAVWVVLLRRRIIP